MNTGHYGCQNMYGRLRRVVVRPPDRAFGAADPLTWNYTGPPDLETAQREHDAFTRILAESGAEIILDDGPSTGSADAIYVHDSSLITDAGAILLNMGKPLRRDEPAAAGKLLDRLGLPILAALAGEARAEGGDLLWVDSKTLAVGQGFRTNAGGLSRLSKILEPLGVETVPVELPHHRGPSCCLHLMSFVSVLDRNLAVVHSPLMPAEFRGFLAARGFAFVEVPEAEFDSMGTNVLATAPRVCLMLEGNPVTHARLEAAGCRVETYRGNEISLKAEGGPTCLTRPILRDS